MLKPRVLHLIHHLHVGGAEVLVADLLPALAQRGFDAQVACLVERGPLFASLERAGIPAHFIGRRPGRDLAAVWRLARLLRRLDVAVLNTHSFSAGFWGRWAALLARTPRVVTTVHTVAGWSQPRKQRLGNRLLRPVTDRIVAVSGCVRDSLIACGGTPPALITVIPNGIRLERFAPCADRAAERRRLGLPPERFLVGMVARCSPEKGGPFWIEALRALAATDGNVHGVLVGDGPARSAWQDLATVRGLAERIAFVGARMDVPRWLAVCDVLVCPSLQESFGITALEAQAAGVPVVATHVDGFRENLHDGVDALLVPVADAHALADAVRQVRRSPELGRCLADAGRRNAARFALASTADQYAALYRELLGLPGGSQ